MPLGLAQGSSNGHSNGAAAAAQPAFEALPNGSLAPALADTAPARPQEARLDPEYAQKLLGPVPGEQKRALHTNLGNDEPKKPARGDTKVGRNEICPCGSGKKFKRCHGVTA